MQNAKRSKKNKKAAPGQTVGKRKINTQKKKNQNNGFNTSSAPAAIATGTITKSPRIRSIENSITIEKREFLGDFFISVINTFGVSETFPLNPGMSKTFPWLSIQAIGWEKFYFEYLRFYVYTRASTQSVGSWILAPDMDAADSAPVTEQVACAYDGAVEDALWKNLVCHIQCDRVKRYTRSQALSPNLDIKTYDAGNLYACYAGATAVANYGKIWVDYKVRLFIPQLPPNGAITGGSVQGGGTMNQVNPLGSVPILNPSSTGISVNGNSEVTLSQLGTYLSTLNLTGTNVTSAGSPQIVSGAATFANNGVVNAAGTGSIVKSEINVTQVPAIINYASGVFATTVGASHIDIGRAPSQSL